MMKAASDTARLLRQAEDEDFIFMARLIAVTTEACELQPEEICP
jgi:hypothetical protein